MNIAGSGARMPTAVAVLAGVCVLTTACGVAASSSPPTATVTVTATPSSGATSTPPSSSQSAAEPTECTTADLRVKAGSGNAAAGTIYYALEFTNVSGATCFVQGYPGVSLVTAGNNASSQIGADAKRDPTTPSKPITLSPGKTAHAILGIGEAVNFPKSKCNPANARWLKVFPPDQTAAAFMPLRTVTCASTSVPTMHITTISAGA
jgi:hypothetical protein